MRGSTWNYQEHKGEAQNPVVKCGGGGGGRVEGTTRKAAQNELKLHFKG